MGRKKKSVFDFRLRLETETVTEMGVTEKISVSDGG